MARSTEADQKPPRTTLLSALAAFFLIGGAAVLGLFGSGAYDKMTGATSKSVGPAGAITYTTISDALVVANPVKPVIVQPTNITKVDALPPDAVTIPSWRAVENAIDDAESGSSGGIRNPLSILSKSNTPETELGTGAVCYPKNGYEIVKMVNGSSSPCRVIVLTRPFTYGYMIERQINVTQPKIIVGNPLAMPMINCTRSIERCFDVQPGGRLDTRFLIMVRGGGRYLTEEKTVKLSFGTHVLVRPGGDFTATGVLFRERNNTLQSFLREAENTISLGFRYLNFNLGQYVTVIGGNLFLQGCVFTRIRPYGAGYLTNFSLGREVLVIAGNAVFTGVQNIAMMLFSSYPYMSGKVLCVLGGTATMIGGYSVYAAGGQMQLGWGIDLTTLGGVLVTIGWSYAAANAALLRVGGGQFGVGGGTVFHTGFSFARAIGAGAFFGAGVTHVNGGGTLTYIGGSYVSFVVSTIFAGVGYWSFQGAGSSTFIAVPQSRYAVTHNVYGNGGVHFLGAGILTLIANLQLSIYLIYYQAGIASDTFIGAGWLTSIRNYRWQFQLIYGFSGLGSQIYIGAGGAIFINTYSYYKRLKYWTSTDYSYTIGGLGYQVKNRQYSLIKLTKNKITVEYYDKKLDEWKYEVKEKGAYPSPSPYSTPAPALTRHVRYDRALQDASQWLQDAVDANGGVDPALNKIVMLDSTVYSSRGGFPTEAQYESQGKGLPYGKFLAKDAMANPYPPAAINSVQPGKVAAINAGCFLCGVKPGNTADHVTMADNGTCEVQEDCTGATPRATFDAAQAKTDQELGYPGRDALPGVASMEAPDIEDSREELPDLYFLWYDMTVYCHSTNTEVDDGSIMEDCLSADYVKRIVRAYVVISDSTLDQGYDMAVDPTAVPQAVKSVLGADNGVLTELQIALTPQWNPGCQGYTTYDVHFSTQNAAVRGKIAAVMDEVAADPTELSQNIVQNANTTAELQPCSVKVNKKADQRYPSINNMPAFKPSSRSKVGPDVVVSDGTSIIPTDEVTPGQTYQIYVQNFPRGSKVNIQLVSGRKDSGPIIAVIDSFNDDGTSEVVTWTAPSTLDSTQRYYLRASSEKVPALFANSQILRGRRK